MPIDQHERAVAGNRPEIVNGGCGVAAALRSLAKIGERRHRLENLLYGLRRGLFDIYAAHRDQIRSDRLGSANAGTGYDHFFGWERALGAGPITEEAARCYQRGGAGIKLTTMCSHESPPTSFSRLFLTCYASSSDAAEDECQKYEDQMSRGVGRSREEACGEQFLALPPALSAFGKQKSRRDMTRGDPLGREYLDGFCRIQLSRDHRSSQ